MLRPPLLSLALLLLSASPAAASDYLIAYGDGFEQVAKAFAEYRATRGRRPRIVRAASLCPEGSSPAARQSALKSYVKNAWREAGSPRGFSLFLLGDTVSPRHAGPDRIPCWLTPDRSQQTLEAGRREVDIAGDNGYALLKGDDVIPDIAVGRLPIRSVESGLLALAKVKRYEAAKDRGAWRRRLNFFASSGGFGIGDKILEWLFARMADDTIPYDFDLTMTYANPKSPYVYLPDAFSAKVIERANEGALILSYIGHGHDRVLDTLNWGGRRYPILRYQDLDRITVGAKAPIFFLIACYTGRFDRSDDEHCIAERLLERGQGPAAVVASSRVSHPYANAVLQKELMELLCRERVATIGEALRAAKERMCRRSDATRRRLELIATFLVRRDERTILRESHCAMYNLFGDPGLEIQYPELQARLSVTPAGKGPRRVTADFGPAQPDAPLDGEAWLSLECERSRIIYALEDVPAALDSEEARALLRRNYTRANGKAVRRWKVPVRAGKLIWGSPPELSVPALKGRYYLKLYAKGPGWDASGSCLVKRVLKSSREPLDATPPAPDAP